MIILIIRNKWIVAILKNNKIVYISKNNINNSEKAQLDTLYKFMIRVAEVYDI